MGMPQLHFERCNLQHALIVSFETDRLFYNLTDWLIGLFLFRDPFPFVQLYRIQLTAHSAVYSQFRSGHIL